MKNKKTFLSSDGKTNINYYVYTPTVEPCAILQISHGMCEYIERYEDLATYLNDNGIIVCGNDHLGHGDADILGYMAISDGDKYLIDDLYKLNILMKEVYPSLPYIMLGHSMGSFIARLYFIKYPQSIDAGIIVGTGGKNPLADIGITLTKIMIAFRGDKYRSKLLRKIAFGSYNKKIKDKQNDFDWLTRDRDIVNTYDKEPRCNFNFTTSGYLTLMSLNRDANAFDWAYRLPTDLPLIMLSGADDPVGDYGKGAMEVYEEIKRAGVTDISLKLYEGGRHEILNETNKQEVYTDILWFIQKIIAM